jgi:hypothetical protein
LTVVVFSSGIFTLLPNITEKLQFSLEMSGHFSELFMLFSKKEKTTGRRNSGGLRFISNNPISIISGKALFLLRALSEGPPLF